MHKVIILLLLLLPLNCKTKANTSSMKQAENMMIIAKGDLYGSGAEGIEKQNMVISNQNDWNSLKDKMNSVNSVYDNFSENEIDFSKHRIIAVFDEVKGSGGHSIELNFTEHTDMLLIEVLYKSPEGMATSVMTQPYYIVKIDKNNLPITFK